MRALLIDEDVRYVIKKLIKYADRNELSLQDLKDTIDGLKEPIGNNPNHACIIPVGHRVVYSIENQPKCKCRHISISVDAEGMLPNTEAVKTIINEFGFLTDLEDGKAHVYIEDGESINVLEPMVD